MIKGNRSDSRIDVQRFIRLLNVLAHYEQGADHLDAAIRAAQRYVKKTAETGLPILLRRGARISKEKSFMLHLIKKD